MTKNQISTIAPELEVSAWLNTDVPLELAQLRGKVVVLHAFQMLCPGCVSHGIPQATLIQQNFSENDVQVIGLHSVFEHHDVMNLEALKAFVSEYRISFPIAVDMASATEVLPLTMKKYQMKGTPTLVIIDKQGQVRLNHFGRANDMLVGGIIGQLVSEHVDTSIEYASTEHTSTEASANVAHVKCDDNGCSI